MDEVINESLQEDASRNRALALYEGTRDDDLVSEEVDERILKLLGLEDVFDIDYGTYMSLLRGRLAEGRLSGKELPREEDELLLNEFRKVKGKVGRFKLKKKKISAENLGATGPIRVSKQQYYLTSKAIVPETSGVGGDDNGIAENITSINRILLSILESVGSQNKIMKKGEENDRKRRENQRRGRAEEGLEKGLGKIASLASKMLAPVQGILDKILNFILYTLLGRAFVAFIDWFNNPKNKQKVEVLKRFLKDWWPALLGALVLFTTPFGAFVRGFIGTVAKLTLKLARFAIPKLLSFVKSNPKTAALLATGTATIGAGIYMQSQREQRDKELQKTDPNYGKTPSPVKSIIDFGSMGGMQFRGGGMVPIAKAFSGGGEQLQPYVGDGYVTDNTGVTVTGAGPDTQATVLQPGEIVFSKPAVDYWGADKLLAMNKMGGGTNIPKFVNNLQMAAGGGMIGKGFKSPSIQMSAPNIKMPNIGGFNSRVTNRQGGTNINLRGSRPTSKNSLLSNMNIRGSKPESRPYSASNMNMLSSRPQSKDYSNKSSTSNSIQNYYGMSRLSSGNMIMNQSNPVKMERRTSSFTQNIFSAPPTTSNISYSPINISTQITPSQRRPVSPGPPVANNAKSSFIELPPIVQQATQQRTSSVGTIVPQFMNPDSTMASINASIYGIG